MRAILVVLALTLCASSGCYFDYSAKEQDDAGVPGVSDADVLVPDASHTVDAPVADDAGADEADAEPGPADAAVADAMPYDVPEPPYTLLSETGLYDDITTQTLTAGVVEFQPVHKLWSDGAFKRRWIRLPPGTQIDTTNMDHWRFPVGTMVWKQFSRITPDGEVLLETRLVQRTGPTPSDTYFNTFIWRPACFDADPGNDADCDADSDLDGADNVNGTTHDVPAVQGFGLNRCIECHAGQRDRILGFGAVQLSYGAVAPITCDANPGGTCPTLRSLATDGTLSAPPPAGVDYPVPGNAVERAAIGYLHANCGHCHFTGGTSNINQCYGDTGGNPSDGIEGFHARVYVDDATPEDTAAFRTTFDDDRCGYDLVSWNEADLLDDTVFNPTCTETSPGNWSCDVSRRGVPGDAQASAVHYRIANRNPVGSPTPRVQMPPIATEIVDDFAADTIADWIDSVVPGAGCPPN